MNTGAPARAALLLGLALAAATLVDRLAAGVEATPRTARSVRLDHVVDLTHSLSEATPFIPVPGITFPFKMTPIATIEAHGVAAYRWEIHEHIGTQIDAPSHFFADGRSIEAIEAGRLIAPLVVIDIRARVLRDPDSAVTVADVLAWEKAHGRIPRGAAVFMWSGWDARIDDSRAFLNADAHDTLHFPGFSAEVAAFLASERDVAGLGVDTLSLDPGVDKAYRAHKAWLATGKWAVEVVASLAQVPASGATVFVGAVKVKGATGGPVRLLAVW